MKNYFSIILETGDGKILKKQDFIFVKTEEFRKKALVDFAKNYITDEKVLNFEDNILYINKDETVKEGWIWKTCKKKRQCQYKVKFV